MTAKTLPQVRKSSHGRVDLSKEREWVIEHGRDYTGQWVILAGGRLIGHTANASEAAGIVDRARAQRASAPHVEFLQDRSDPIWMGWQ